MVNLTDTVSYYKFLIVFILVYIPHEATHTKKNCLCYAFNGFINWHFVDSNNWYKQRGSEQSWEPVDFITDCAERFPYMETVSKIICHYRADKKKSAVCGFLMTPMADHSNVNQHFTFLCLCLTALLTGRFRAIFEVSLAGMSHFRCLIGWLAHTNGLHD